MRCISTAENRDMMEWLHTGGGYFVPNQFYYTLTGRRCNPVGTLSSLLHVIDVHGGRPKSLDVRYAMLIAS
jgi:hypothetical protein